MSAAAQSARRILQINTDGAWRDLIAFERDNDLVCAHVLTAAPLLAAAGGPRTRLRICTDDEPRTVHSLWAMTTGWRPPEDAETAAAPSALPADADIAREALRRLHGALVGASHQVCRLAADPSRGAPDFSSLRARLEYAEHALAQLRRAAATSPRNGVPT